MNSAIYLTLDKDIRQMRQSAKQRFDTRGCSISGATPAALQAYERATLRLDELLRLQPRDALALHVMAHVFEMSERADEGVH